MVNHWISIFLFLHWLQCCTGQPMVDLHDHVFRMCKETCQKNNTYFSQMYLPLSFHFQDISLRSQAFFQCLCSEKEIENLKMRTIGTVYEATFWSIIDLTPHVHGACEQQVHCNETKNPFHALLEERFVLNSYSLKAKKYFSSTLDYYNRKFWDADNGFSSFPRRHYWKDNQYVTLDPNITSNLCFNRLHSYTWNHQRIAPHVYNPLKIWSNRVIFEKSFGSINKIPSIVFVNLLVEDKKNPYWFLNPKNLFQLGGGIEAFIISIPTYAPPINDAFSPINPFNFKSLATNSYNVLSFPLVPGGSYHLQLTFLKGYSLTKKFRIIPASLHDIRLSLQKKKPTLRSLKEFDQFREIKNGSLYILSDILHERHTVESNQFSHFKTQHTSTHGINKTLEPLTTATMPIPLKTNYLKEQIYFYKKVSSFFNSPSQRTQKDIVRLSNVINESMQWIEPKQLMQRLTSMKTFFHFMKNEKPFKTGQKDDQRHTADRPLYELVHIALKENDWSGIERLEHMRISLRFHEYQSLLAKRSEIIFILFEPFIQPMVLEAFITLDNRVLNIFKSMAYKRLWRAFLIALHLVTEAPRKAAPPLLNCPFLRVLLKNETILQLPLQDVVLPSFLNNYRQEIQDEKNTLLEIDRKLFMTTNKTRNWTAENAWIQPYCIFNQKVNRTVSFNLKNKFLLTDPAGIVAKIILPLFFFKNNLVTHGLLLKRLVERYPLKENETNVEPLGSFYTKDINASKAWKIKENVFQDDLLFRQWVASWKDSFVTSLAKTIVRFSHSPHLFNKVYPLPEISLTGCLPKIKNYVTLMNTKYSVEEMIRQHNPPYMSESHDKLRSQHRLIIDLDSRKVFDKGKSAVERQSYEDVKKLVKKRQTSKLFQYQNGSVISYESVELRISASDLTNILSISDVLSILNQTVLQHDTKGIVNHRIILTLKDVLKAPKKMFHFFLLTQHQKLQKTERDYITHFVYKFPHLVDKLIDQITKKMKRHHIAPLLIDKDSRLTWKYCVPCFEALSDLKSHQNYKLFTYRLEKFYKLPFSILARVEKYLYYQDLLWRLQHRNSAVVAALFQDTILKVLQTTCLTCATPSFQIMFFKNHLRPLTFCDIMDHEEDFLRFQFQTNSLDNQKHHFVSQEYPLWDVLILPLNQIHPDAPPIKFFIDKRDPHSYFFKGHSNQYEPNSLSNYFSLAKGHGMISGHHFSIYIH